MSERISGQTFTVPSIEGPASGESENTKRQDLERAIADGHRTEAARLRGEVLGLTPVGFPEGQGPTRLWSTKNLPFENNPYRQYDGNAKEFIGSEVETRMAEQKDHPEISKYLLNLVGVDPGDRIYSPDDALDTYLAARLASEVGTYRIDENTGGISYRTPDGHLQSFVWPQDPQRQDVLESSLKAAGYTPQNPGVLQPLPVLVTRNREANDRLFEQSQA